MYLCFKWWNQGGLGLPISEEILVTEKSQWKAKLDKLLVSIHTYIHIFYLNTFQVSDIFDMLYKNFGQVNMSCELLRQFDIIITILITSWTSFQSLSSFFFFFWLLVLTKGLWWLYCEQDNLKPCGVWGPVVTDCGSGSRVHSSSLILCSFYIYLEALEL